MKNAFKNILLHLLSSAAVCAPAFGAAGGGSAYIQDSRVVMVDTTTGNRSTNRHGFGKKLSGDSSQVEDGLGNWVPYYRTNFTAVVERNTNLVLVAPYDTAASGTANFGQTGGQTSYEWITYGHSYRLRQHGTIEQVKLYVGATTDLTGFTVGIWRKNSAGTYDQIGVSANLSGSLTAASLNTLAVNIPGVQEGDFIGGRMTWASATAYNLFARTGVSAVTNYATVNTATTTSAFAWASQTATAGTVPVIECYMQAPHAVFIGDSIMAGHGASSTEHYTFIEPTDSTHIRNSAPYHVTKAFNWTYQNMAIGGQQLTNVNARILADVVNLKPRYVVNNIGRNGLTGSETLSQHTNEWNYFLSTVTDAGITPVVVLMIHGSDLSNVNDPLIDTYNDALIALCRTAYPNVIICNANAYVCTNSPMQSPATNLYNFRSGFSDDTIHLSATGARAYGQAIVDAIQQPQDYGRIRYGDRILMEPGEVASSTVIAPALAFSTNPRTGWDKNPAADGWSFYIDGNREIDIDASGNFNGSSDGSFSIGTGGSRPNSVAVKSYLEIGATAGGPSLGTGGIGYNSTTGRHTAKDALGTRYLIPTQVIILSVGDETTALTVGNGKYTFRMPYAFTLTSVRASLTTASSSGLPEIDVRNSGVTIFSTRPTLDATERSTTTAATPSVLSVTSLSDSNEIIVDVVTAGTGAAGLKVYLIGYQ